MKQHLRHQEALIRQRKLLLQRMKVVKQSAHFIVKNLPGKIYQGETASPASGGGRYYLFLLLRCGLRWEPRWRCSTSLFSLFSTLVNLVFIKIIILLIVVILFADIYNLPTQDQVRFYKLVPNKFSFLNTMINQEIISICKFVAFYWILEHQEDMRSI